MPRRVRAQWVPRPRLDDLVSDAVDGSALTLVSAPAGAGKTVALSTWVATRQPPGPLVWAPTVRAGQGTARLWDAVVQRLVRAGADAPPHALAHGTGAGRPDFARLAAMTRAVAEVAGPLVVVVDEDEQAPDPVLHAELDRYLESAWGSVRVILLTRSDPMLPLHRYRLAGGLSEIRADDLRFSRAEAAGLLDSTGVRLSDEQLTTLLDRSCGWAAGLTFAATYLAGHADLDSALGGFTGSQRAVSDYLAKEVLDAQPANLRELMLRTSVAHELPIGLFEELSGEPDGRQVLAFLAGSNAFIGPVPGNPTSYKYQPLFREFLRSRLSFERPDLLTELHGVAACWFARSGNLREAALHAVAAGLWSQASAYAVQNLAVGQLLDSRLDGTLARLFEDMPAATTGGPAAIVRAALALRTGDVAGARLSLDDARAHMAEDGSASSADAFSVELLEAALAVVALDLEHGLEKLRIADRHLTTLQPSEPDLREEVATQLALLRSRLHLWSGSVYAARAALREAAEPADGQGGALQATVWTQGALLAAILGDADEALTLLDRADRQTNEQLRRVGPTSARAAVARAWVLTEQGNVRDGRAHAALADGLRAELGSVACALLDIVRARLSHANGDYLGSRAALAGARAALSQAPAPVWVAEWVDLAEAVHEAAEGGAAREGHDDVVVPLLPHWLGEPPVELQVTSVISEADARLRRDDEAAAVTLLAKALRLASRQGLRRPFTEAPPAVRQLLRNHEHLQEAHPWLAGAGDQLATLRVPRPRGAPALEACGMPLPVVVEPLTNKELEVLGHLTELATTAEIGAAMFISVNTVRTHIRSILRKLAVSRRNQAVRRAWELGLVPAPGVVDAAEAGNDPADPATGQTA